MSFLAGSVTFLRFKVGGPAPLLFDGEHLARLADHAIGRQRIASADGVETGWAAGQSILDTDFALEKNVYPDALVFDLCVETDRLPADRLKAYYEAELKALARDNPSGRPSARQKREAKEAARDRLELEAKDGRFKKRKLAPVMWDAKANEVLFGATSLTHVDRLTSLFEQTFGLGLMPLTAGVVSRLADPHGHARLLAEQAGGIEGLTPAAFVHDKTPDQYAWIAHEDDRSWLANELLLWLWYYADRVSDDVQLPDGSDLTFMFARQLRLDCPRGQTGVDGFKHEGPARLPEALRAVRAGKLPRVAGLTLVRHDAQYELTLHAEAWGVAGAKLPAADDDATGRAVAEHRLDAVRSLRETLDLLFAAFLKVRTSERWGETLDEMRDWLALPVAAPRPFAEVG